MNCCQFHLRVRYTFILFSEHPPPPPYMYERCKKLPTFESGLSARSSRYRASIIPLSANCRKCICVRGQRILRQNAKMKMRRPLRHNREQDLAFLLPRPCLTCSLCGPEIKWKIMNMAHRWQSEWQLILQLDEDDDYDDLGLDWTASTSLQQ